MEAGAVYIYLPLFQLTYLPIAVAALFRKVEWKPIKHEVSKTLDEIR